MAFTFLKASAKKTTAAKPAAPKATAAKAATPKTTTAKVTTTKAATTTKSTTGTRYLTLAIEKDSKFTSITYNAIKNSYLTLSTCKEYWDDKAKAPYCYDTASRTFISYDNPRSIQAKCDYVVSKGVRGLMWWDYGSDTTGDLIKAVNGKLTTMKQN